MTALGSPLVSNTDLGEPGKAAAVRERVTRGGTCAAEEVGWPFVHLYVGFYQVSLSYPLLSELTSQPFFSLVLLLQTN